MTGVEYSDRKGAMREVAATWFAVMRGPDAEARRAQFEAWLAQDPLHRDAYSRIAEIFSLGKGLAAPAPQQPPESAIRDRGRARYLIVPLSLLIATLGSGAWILTRSASYPSSQSVMAETVRVAVNARYATRRGQISRIRLADGSVVTLDTNSAIDVAFDQANRHLRLRSGRARFDVAHEDRPFVVSAGNGSVTAHGTVFDVAMQSSGTVAVRLLRGMIDVALPGGTSRTPKRQPLVERLSPGQQVVMVGLTLTSARTLPSPIDANWPIGELECDRAPLATVARAANRYSTVRIVFADPALGDLRVSGAIRIDDARKLADRLALLFDLRVDRSDPAQVVLRAP